MRNLQEQVKKAICYQKLFWHFTVRTNFSSDDLKIFSQSEVQFFLTVGQNNFGNKIPLLWVGDNGKKITSEATRSLKIKHFIHLQFDGKIPLDSQIFFSFIYFLSDKSSFILSLMFINSLIVSILPTIPTLFESCPTGWLPVVYLRWLVVSVWQFVTICCWLF